MKKHGFTLVEIMVVVLILGIAAAAVTLKLAGPVSRVKLQDVVTRLRLFDENTRSYARQQGKDVWLKVDLKKGRIERLDADDKQVGRPAELPDGFKIDKFIIASQNESLEVKSIEVTSKGLSRSYAMQITGKSQSTWLFYIGLSGQMIELDDEHKVYEIMESLSRDNAD